MMTRTSFGWKKRLLILVGLLGVLLVVISGWVLVKDRDYFHSAPYERGRDAPADAVVVYYSRSGNTEAMAREIARALEADIVKLEAGAYGLDFSGWYSAATDSWNRRTTSVFPATVDLTPYELVVLGSPIWWYRPAPPLWAFVEQNDFEGKSVVLFNTFNSRFKPEAIEELRTKIEARGGSLVDHVYVRRGRVFFQKSGDELISESRALLETKMGEWRALGD